MKQPCIHCGVVNSHRPNCIVAVVKARDDRDAAREARADGPPIARESTPKYVAINRAVMCGQEHICTASNNTLARRIARALNHHTPNEKGI